MCLLRFFLLHICGEVLPIHVTQLCGKVEKPADSVCHARSIVKEWSRSGQGVVAMYVPSTCGIIPLFSVPLNSHQAVVLRCCTLAGQFKGPASLCEMYPYLGSQVQCSIKRSSCCAAVKGPASLCEV